MPKSNFSVSDIENWNNAKRFSEEKIMRILNELDRLEIESEFGFNNEKTDTPEKNIEEGELSSRKIKAFKFFIARMIQLMRNAKFSITNDRANFDSYLNKLLLINSAISKLYTKLSDEKVILNKNYKIILEYAKEIKSGINEPLNKNNLIFVKTNEFDLEELMKQDEENFINKS